MTKFSGTVTSKTLSNNSIKYSVAVQNFTKRGSTEKPEVTWIELKFSNREVEAAVAEKIANLKAADEKGRNPHMTITEGQLLTESFTPKNATKPVYKTVLKIFNADNIEKTVFQPGVVASFNLVENVHARILDDFEKVGTDIMKGRIAINHKKYTDKDGNEVRPAVFLDAKLFKVPENIQDKFKKGVTIKILKANFSTNSFKKEGEENARTYTDLIIGQYELILQKDTPRTEDTENITSPKEAPTVQVKAPVIDVNEDEIPF